MVPSRPVALVTSVATAFPGPRFVAGREESAARAAQHALFR